MLATVVVDGVLPRVAEEEEEGVAVLGSTRRDPDPVIVVVVLLLGYPGKTSMATSSSG